MYKPIVERGTRSLSSLSDNLKSMGNKMKGEVKESVGKATNDPKLRAEGKLDHLKGEAQEKMAELKENISNKMDELSDKRK